MQKGATLVQPARGNGNIGIKGGLIQDWIGAIFIPSANLSSVLAVAQDYARHNEIYKPEVASTLVRSHTGNDFSVYMRIVKSKFFLTDVLNTEHEIHFVPIDAKRVYSRAYSTRVAEVSDPGTPREHELPVGKDRGLMWRLYGYWFYEERERRSNRRVRIGHAHPRRPLRNGTSAVAHRPRATVRIPAQGSGVNPQNGFEKPVEVVT